MKILIVSSSFFPKIDGSTRCVYDHARSMAARGHEVYLLTRGIEGTSRTENLEGIRVLRTSVSYRSGSALDKFRMMLEQVVSVVLLQRRVRFDVIHAHGFTSGFACVPCRTLYGVPLVITTHGTELLWPKALWWKSDAEVKLGVMFERFVLRHCDVVVAQSKGVVDYMLRIYSKDLARKVRVIPTGVDHRKFRPPDRSEPSKVVMFVGALSEIKGVSGLIESFAEAHRSVEGSKLVLVGSGPRKEYYVDFVNRLGIAGAVKFEGAVRDDAKLASLYSEADIVVLPSNVGGPISCTILEGLSCGRAVISTNVPGGIPDVLGGGVGYLVEKGDWKGLARDLTILLTDRSALASAGENARRAVEQNYTLDMMIDRLTSLYREVAA